MKEGKKRNVKGKKLPERLFSLRKFRFQHNPSLISQKDNEVWLRETVAVLISKLEPRAVRKIKLTPGKFLPNIRFIPQSCRTNAPPTLLFRKRTFRVPRKIKPLNPSHFAAAFPNHAKLARRETAAFRPPVFFALPREKLCAILPPVRPVSSSFFLSRRAFFTLINRMWGGYHSASWLSSDFSERFPRLPLSLLPHSSPFAPGEHSKKKNGKGKRKKEEGFGQDLKLKTPA